MAKDPADVAGLRWAMLLRRIGRITAEVEGGVRIGGASKVMDVGCADDARPGNEQCDEKVCKSKKGPVGP